MPQYLKQMLKKKKIKRNLPNKIKYCDQEEKKCNSLEISLSENTT